MAAGWVAEKKLGGTTWNQNGAVSNDTWLAEEARLHKQHETNVPIRIRTAGERAMSLGPSACELRRVCLAALGLEQSRGGVGLA